MRKWTTIKCNGMYAVIDENNKVVVTAYSQYAAHHYAYGIADERCIDVSIEEVKHEHD